MVAMGIKGYNDEGLSSQAWREQKPMGLDGFFAGASNIIFTFGGYKAGGGTTCLPRQSMSHSLLRDCQALLPPVL